MTIPMLVMTGLATVGDSDSGAAVLAGPESFERFRQAEIQHLHRAVIAHLDVGRLQIAMDDPLFVCSFHRVGDLSGDGDGFVNRDRPLCDPLREVRSCDELHDQRANRQAVLETVNLRDVRMIERGQRLRFSRKTRQAIGVARERVRQDLQRDVAIEPGVSRAIHLAHAAGADGAGDFV